MNFAAFKIEVEKAGLEARDCGNGHWQIVGGPLLVNYYPTAKKGPSVYVAGTKLGYRGSAEIAIKAAFKAPKFQGKSDHRRGNKSRARKKRLFQKIQKCCWCEVPLVLDKVKAVDGKGFATLEHIIPLDRGGLDNMNNLTLACEECNNRRGNNMPELKTPTKGRLWIFQKKTEEKSSSITEDERKEFQALKELAHKEVRMNHKDRAHAIFAPSAMDRTMKCPGSVVLSETVEQITSEYAEEGTLAHECGEAFLHAGLNGDLLKPIDVSKYDEDMVHYGREYAEFILMLLDKFDHDSAFVEERVHFSDLIWGTADFLAMRTVERAKSFDLLFVDYKYGQGVKVSPEDNAQLKTYIAAATKRFEGQLRKAYAYIYQPRVGDKPYSRAIYTGEDIEEWSKKLVALEQMYPKVKQNPEKYLDADGLSHCKFCPYKTHCKEFYNETRGKALIEMEPEQKIPAVESLTLEQRVQIFSVKKEIETYLKDVEHSILTDALQGIEIPGYKVVSGRSQRKWIDDEEKVVDTLKELGVEDPYKKSLIGIGEAEKLIEGSKKVVSEKISPITQKPTGKLQLAPADDKRPAIRFEERQAVIENMEIE